jgi:hypothetical protein
MTDARTFLDSLNDCELSFVYCCRYDTYMKDCGQQLLDDEVLRRHLTHERMQQYVCETEYQLGNTGCVRCNTEKPLIKKVCQVCAHVYRPNKIVRIKEKEEPRSVRAVIGEMLLEILLSGMFS